MITRLLGWFLGYGVPVLLLIGGVGGLWISLDYLMLAWSSSSWPTTDGTIIRSELGSQSDSRRDEERTHYWANIEFEYEVSGNKHRSENIRLDGLRRSGSRIGTGKEDAEQLLAQYPVGSQVSVYYDSNDPARSTLQTGLSVGNWFVPVFAALLTVIGLGWLVMMLFSRGGENSQWSGRERTCPKCRTIFSSVQDKGACPQCKHVFYASETAGIPLDM